MHVISMKRLRDFWERHPEAESPLRHWYKVTSKAKWQDLHDARATFPHADPMQVSSASTMTVFNVGGNKYRLVARVHYEYGRIYVKRVLTHADYSKDRWKEQL